MEHPDFRANLLLLNERFPERDMLSLSQIMQVYGYKSTASVYGGPIGPHLQKGGKISKAKLARLMCV